MRHRQAKMDRANIVAIKSTHTKDPIALRERGHRLRRGALATKESEFTASQHKVLSNADLH